MNKEDAFLLENAAWAVFLTDASGLILRANAQAIRIFGPALAEPSAGLKLIWPPGTEQTVEEFLAAGKSAATNLRLLKLSLLTGEVSSLLASVSPTTDNYLLVQLFPERSAGATEKSPDAVNATQAQKQKLDRALQLTRTISLDFNNALTAILGHASLLLSKTEQSHPWRNALLEIEKSAVHAAEISNDLASFSRKEKAAPVQTSGNLNPLIHRCAEFFQKQPAPDRLDWELHLERNLFTCKFDPLKMQQALLRVIENSVQALNGPGRIVIQSRNLELKDATQDRNVKLPPGNYICVEISDNGSGIEPEVLPKIFEPFFTTKRDKKHRGLGLAWVYGIVTNHGGGVAVSSELGKGTSVRIYLPAESSYLAETLVFTNDLRGTQTVLLVDDEKLILTMGQMVLSEHGYKVLTAESGQRALDILAKGTEAVDLLVTDLVMPAMSGRQLIEQIQKLFQGMRILCMSGYPLPAPRVNQFPFIQKPFTAQELLLKVKTACSE